MAASVGSVPWPSPRTAGTSPCASRRPRAPGPARPVFRPDPDLLLLVTRLQLDSSGHVMVPGNLEAWEQILRQKTDSKVVRQWAKRANHWKNPDQLVEALFAFSRQSSAEGPLQIYLMLSAIDGARPPERRCKSHS